MTLLFNLSPLLAIPILYMGASSLLYANMIAWSLYWLMGIKWAGHTYLFPPIFDLDLWKRLIKGGLPFLANAYIMALYILSSVFLLRYFAGDGAVGKWGCVREGGCGHRVSWKTVGTGFSSRRTHPNKALLRSAI